MNRIFKHFTGLTKSAVDINALKIYRPLLTQLRKYPDLKLIRDNSRSNGLIHRLERVGVRERYAIGDSKINVKRGTDPIDRIATLTHEIGHADNAYKALYGGNFMRNSVVGRAIHDVHKKRPFSKNVIAEEIQANRKAAGMVNNLPISQDIKNKVSDNLIKHFNYYGPKQKAKPILTRPLPLEFNVNK